MHCSSAVKERAVAGLWVISLFFTTGLAATELTLPASLQSNQLQSAPAYIPVATPSATLPAHSSWLEVNQRVSQIGGWMFYASEDEAEHSERPEPEPEKRPDNHGEHK